MNHYQNCAFIFDMDGTIVDNMHVHTEAWGRLLAENNKPFDPHDFLVKTAGKTNREIMPTVFGDISLDRIDELAARKEEIYREMFLPIRKPHTGLVALLEGARKLGIKTGVATASRPRNVSFILDDLDLRRLFDTVTTADEIVNGKPDPEIFLLSALKLGVKPENCIVFEDAFGGFEAAHRAGMKLIGIATVNSVEEMLKQQSVVEAHADFSELDAQEIIDTYVPFRAKAN